MKKRILQFLTTYFLFVLLFVLQKPIFMAYYHELYTDASIGDYFSVMWHGLPLDFSLAGYLTAIPGFLLIASAWTKSSILRRIRQGSFNRDRQLGEGITGLPDDSVYFTYIAAVGFALSARSQNERLLSTSL